MPIKILPESGEIDMTLPPIVRGYLSRTLKDFSPEYVTNFINKSYDETGIFDNLDVVSNKIIGAITSNKSVMIFGDYDVDGITSTVLMAEALEMICEHIGSLSKISYFVPSRDLGYGLTYESIDKIMTDPPQLLITVDCGIRSVDEVQTLIDSDVDVIVTDHHQPGDVVPNTLVLNPYLSDTLVFRDICGCAVALKLVEHMLVDVQYNPYDSDELLCSLYQLAAIATVADMMPLSNLYNRYIVWRGMLAIKTHPRKSLKMILDYLKISELTANDISFTIAPMINASGRMSSPEHAINAVFEYFDGDRLSEIAHCVNLNNQRKQEQADIVQEVVASVGDVSYRARPFLCVLTPSPVPSGIVGIIASNLVNRYKRPVVVLNGLISNGLYIGSGRSVEGFDLISAMNKIPHVFDKYGGHVMAAGMSIHTEKLDEFIEHMTSAVLEELGENYEPDYTVYANAIIDMDLTLENIYDLVGSYLEPIATDMPQPTFVFRGATLVDCYSFGDRKQHVNVQFEYKGNRYKAVMWNKELNLLNNTMIDVAFRIQKSNRGKIEMFLEGINPYSEIDSKDFVKTYGTHRIV